MTELVPYSNVNTAMFKFICEQHVIRLSPQFYVELFNFPKHSHQNVIKAGLECSWKRFHNVHL